MLAADGHTADGSAYWLPWAHVLVCGDYVSPVEIPMISRGGSLLAYRATLARLSGLIAQAEWIVPGHGAPLTRSRAQEVLAEDDRYLAELQHDASTARLPPSRAGSPQQEQIHADNVAAVTAEPTS
jgi:glyoxylase-like metal-dependent hydrolase (beta-lactamase superfamily II)